MAGDGGRRRAVAVTASVVAACVVALLAAWLVPLAVGRGWVAGPAFQVRLGEYHLIARTTTRPECLPLTVHECFVSFPNPPSSTPPFYTVWAGRITALPATGFSPLVTVSTGRQLLKIAVRREPGPD